MNSSKFPNGSDLARSLAASMAAAQATAAPAHNDGSADSAHPKETFSQQSGIPFHMRQGRIQRMPLQPAKANRPRVPRNIGRINNHEDEPQFDMPVDVLPAVPSSRDIPLDLRSRQDGERQEPESGDRSKRNLKGLFSMSMPSIQRSATGANGTKAAGKPATAAESLKKTDAIGLAPLPELHSLNDVLRLIHAACKADPSAKSVEALQRQINAAVLQNKITLPKIARIEDARALLVEIFGKGHQGPTELSSTLRGLHITRPVWLLNLGRARTPTHKAHAAARVSSQRMFNTATG